MTCPEHSEWARLSMDLLDEAEAATLLTHARQCAACREALRDARREHEQLTQAFKVFDETHAAQREQLLATLSETAEARPRGRRRLGASLMRLNTPIVRRSAAVLLPAACLVYGIFLFVNPAQQSAFAMALEHLRKAQTIVCEISMPEGVEVNGIRIHMEGQMKISEQYGSTTTLYMNGMEMQRHYARTGGPVIAVQPMTKTWMEFDVSELQTMEANEQSPDAFVRQLAKLRDGDSAELGQETIEDHLAVGYRIPGEKLGLAARSDGTETAHADLWVDADTCLPVRFVMQMTIPNADGPMVMQYDHFEWNVPVPATDFEPSIPDDYTKINAKFAKPSEAALLNALQRLSDLLHGKYPPVFDMVSVLGQVTTMMAQEDRHKLDELGQSGIIQLSLEIGSGAMYYAQLVKDGHEPEYFGDTVTKADTDKVLLRWKLDDGQLRVIYGDLHAETLPAPAGEKP